MMVAVPDIALAERFHEAEVAVDKRPMLTEMIDVVTRERDGLGNSMLVAHKVYGAPFHQEAMRRYVALRYVVDLLERISAVKAEVTPILYPEIAPRRRRA